MSFIKNFGWESREKKIVRGLSRKTPSHLVNSIDDAEVNGTREGNTIHLPLRAAEGPLRLIAHNVI